MRWNLRQQCCAVLIAALMMHVVFSFGSIGLSACSVLIGATIIVLAAISKRRLLCAILGAFVASTLVWVPYAGLWIFHSNDRPLSVDNAVIGTFFWCSYSVFEIGIAGLFYAIFMERGTLLKIVAFVLFAIQGCAALWIGAIVAYLLLSGKWIPL